MIRTFPTWAIVVAFLSSAGARASAGNTITVHVSTFRSEKGSLHCRLYSRADGFPGKPPYQAEQTVAVTGKTMACVFPGVAAGTYAVAVFHDENGNGKLDTNFLGIPREGVGVSNNKMRSMGPPTWDDSRFALTGDTALSVTLHY
jgi:uncharacterized protein (DUF2141 family)